MKNLPKSRNIYIRNNIIWIDYQKDKKRVRRSTGIKNSALAFRFVKQNYDSFLGSKEDVKKTREKYYELENEYIEKKIIRQEQKKCTTSLPMEYSEYSFEQIINELLKEKQFLKYKTIETYKESANIIRAFLNKKKIFYIFDFIRSDSLDFLSYLKKNNYSKKTIELYLTFFNMVFNYAQQNGIIEANPFFVPRMKSEIELEQKIKVFSLDEALLLIKNATGELRTFLILGFFTGARTGEIFALTFNDLDFENNEIRICKTMFDSGLINSPKTKSSNRVIDMLGIVKNELSILNFKDKNERIFKVSLFKIRKEFSELQKKLGLQRRRLYDTRHSFASIMLSKGEEPMWVGCKMMGHKNLNETYRTYAKYLPKNVVERANFLNNLNL